MIGLGAVTTALAVLGLWLTRRGRLPDRPLFWRVLIWSTPLAIFGNGFGWIFTEMGRQPWIVFGLMLTEDGVSPNVPGWTVLISLIAFTLIYLALAIVEFGLIFKTVREGPAPLPGPDDPDPSDLAVEETPSTVY